jgi:hypothetical protein
MADYEVPLALLAFVLAVAVEEETLTTVLLAVPVS